MNGTIFKLHPKFAYDLLKDVDYLHSVLPIPYSHHELWNGSGYPQGLAGLEIPLVARIFAVVDVWDALISDRPYRPAWQLERAIHYIRMNAGILYDPFIVDIFLEMVEENSSHISSLWE